jgi:hypothetical protein
MDWSAQPVGGAAGCDYIGSREVIQTMANEARKRLDSKLQAMIDGARMTPRELLLKMAQDESCPKHLRDQAAETAKQYLPEICDGAFRPSE